MGEFREWPACCPPVKLNPNSNPTRAVNLLRHVRYGCLSLAVGLLFPACKPVGKPVHNQEIAGVYGLVAVNDRKLPASVTHEGVALQVRSGSFTFNADGTCATQTTFVLPAGREVVRDVRATYTRDGGRFTMKWQGAGTTVGTLETNTFTMDNEGMRFTYRK